MTDNAPKVAVVVPVHNSLDHTLRFLESFRQVTYPGYTIVIADDGSTDGVGELLAKRYPEVVVLRGDGSLWWSGATNLGVQYALDNSFAYVLTINNDTAVAPDFLTRLVETAQLHPRSIVGSRINLLDAPSRIWAIGARMRWSRGKIFRLSANGREELDILEKRANPCEVETLTGCGTLIPVECFREVGLYDARECPQYHGDAEFILRARRFGYRPLVDLRAVVWNDAGHTTAESVRGVYSQLFSLRSAVYWRPVTAVHRRYCPRVLLPLSLAQYYGRYICSHDPRILAMRRTFRRVVSYLTGLRTAKSALR